MGRPRGRPRKSQPATKGTRKVRDNTEEKLKTDANIDNSTESEEAVCFFCQSRYYKKKGPTIKGEKSRRQHHLSKMQQRGWETIQLAVKTLNREDYKQRLQHLFGKPASEVNLRYHTACFVSFSSQASRPSPNPEERGWHEISKKPFEAFCEKVIKDRIIGKREVMTGRRLHRKYRKMVSRIDGVRISKKTNFRNLKRKLLETFPDLQFERAKKRWYYPQVVFHTRTLEVDDILSAESDMMPTGVDTDSESDIKGDSQSESEHEEESEDRKGSVKKH